MMHEITLENSVSVDGAFNQLTIEIGMLVAQIVNMLIADPVSENSVTDLILQSWKEQWGWRWMFWAECVPSR